MKQLTVLPAHTIVRVHIGRKIKPCLVGREISTTPVVELVGDPTIMICRTRYLVPIPVTAQTKRLLIELAIHSRAETQLARKTKTLSEESINRRPR